MNDQIIPYKFIARDYQVPFLSEIERSMLGKSDIRCFYLVWHRRSGKDKVNIADVVPRRLIQNPTLVKYVYPTLVMGRDNLWDGIGSDGSKYIDHIPEFIRAGELNKSRMTIPIKTVMGGESLFQVAGADRPDSLRGGNAQLYVFSEWSDHDPYAWDVVEPILRENNGIAVFNMTPKGNNHALGMYEYARNNPKWYVQTLTAEDTKIWTPQQLEKIKTDILYRFRANGRSDSEAAAYFDQEYMCSFKSPVIGAYYGEAIMRAEREGRISNVPYDQALPVDTWWDLGIDDSMTIWFTQTLGREIRFIDYYESSGEGLAHYVRVLQDKHYIFRKHYAPHDIKVRELGTGKTRLETAKKLGLRFDVAPNIGIDDGIDAARSVFNQCWFDKTKCMRGLNCLRNYRKEWDEKNKVFKSNAKHDWASHGADSFRIFAVSYKEFHGLNATQVQTGGVQRYIEGVG